MEYLRRPSDPLMVLRIVVLVNSVALAILACMVPVAFVWNDHRIEENTTTRAAVCVLRADLAQRVKEADKFLRDHPDGALHLEPDVIRDSIRNQRRTINALANIDCTTER